MSGDILLAARARRAERMLAFYVRLAYWSAQSPDRYRWALLQDEIPPIPGEETKG